MIKYSMRDARHPTSPTAMKPKNCPDIQNTCRKIHKIPAESRPEKLANKPENMAEHTPKQHWKPSKNLQNRGPNRSHVGLGGASGTIFTGIPLRSRWD